MANTSRSQSRLDRLFERLSRALRDRDSRKRAFGRIFGILRKALLLLNGTYLLWLLLLPLLLRFVGERNVTFAFLLYIPLQIWLLPLVALSLVALIFHWRIVPFNLLATLLFVLFAMGFELGSADLPAKRAADSLTVMTYNRGQHMNQSLKPFKSKVLPDLLLMQEAFGRAPRYKEAEGYEEFVDTAGEGEFIVLSKFPIGASELIHGSLNDADIPVAARFEIDWNGRNIAVYAVHLPSPRDVLRYYVRGAFLYGVIGLPGTPFAEKRRVNQRFWDDRIEVARSLAERMEADPLPVIVVGDFNAPHPGYIHGIFDTALDDTHKKSGSGFGFSFPGTTRNPLSLGGPWMRIDHIFFDPRHWTAKGSIAEKNRPSQHRAVAAVLRVK